MTVLPLVIAPDPRLKTVSEPVSEITDEIRMLVEDMFETMYHSHGIGLAAVQVGVLKKILVVDVEWKDESTPGKQHVLINAEVIEDSKEPYMYKEGCLSFPEQFAEVERPKSVKIRFMDLTGKEREEEFEGLLATCIQHEIDHTNGIVFVDHISRMKRDMIHRRLNKMKKLGVFDHDHHVHSEACNH